MEISFYVKLILIFILTISIVVELHAYFVKTTFHESRRAQTIAFANWIIYVARILNMIFAFLLALSLEHGLNLQLSIIFASGFFFGTVLSVLYLNSRRFEKFITASLSLVFFIPFSNFRHEKFWRATHNVLSRRWGGMFITAAMAYMALLVPFIVARLYPEYRMSAVYVGQAFNFASTIILLSAVEPRMMFSLDEAEEKGGKALYVDGFIHSRVWVTGILCLCCLSWFFYVR